MNIILISAVSLGALGLFFGLCLAYASKVFAVEVDPRVEQVLEALPGANCGGCGYAGCAGFAEAVVAGKVDVGGCAPGGGEVARKIAQILGTEAGEQVEVVAIVKCQGGTAEAKEKYRYAGLPDCRAAVLLGGGSKECSAGCLGLGSCITACNFDAIHVNDNGVALVNDAKCTGCGACIKACPKNIIELLPRDSKVYLACSNHEKGAKVKKYCTVGCIGCSLCVKATASGAVEMQDNLPVMDHTKEENFVAAWHKCPQNCFIDKQPHRPRVFIDTKCNGCGECVKVCPVKGAIEGEEGQRYQVVSAKCIGCGLCIPVCDPKAIASVGALGYVEVEKEG